MVENPNVICNDCGFGKQNKELEDKYERLEKQLKIAEKYLKKLTHKEDWRLAREVLQQIKELNK